MNPISKKSVMLMVAAVSLVATQVHAEYLGLLSGRSANPGNMTDLSVELGFVNGDLGIADYQNIGARINYRATPEVVVYGDIGASEFGNADGTPLGLGVLYHLSRQRISQTVDIAGKASYHTGEYTFRSFKGDLSSLSFEVLVSSREPLAASGLGWYGNFGLHRLKVDIGISDSTTEFGVGAGLTLPAGRGEAYAGFDHIDEFSVGVGFRYFVQ